MEAYDGPQIVGMDLHPRRSVLGRMSEDGRKLATARIANSPARLAAEIRRAGPQPQVVLEACYGWYWAADALAAAVAEVHLARAVRTECLVLAGLAGGPLIVAGAESLRRSGLAVVTGAVIDNLCGRSHAVLSAQCCRPPG